MGFVEYAVHWCRGEIFEGRMVALFGLAVTGVAIAFWRMGGTPFARAMPVPLLVVGLITLGGGIYLDVANAARIPKFEEAARADEEAFARAEKTRTESFLAWYPITRWSVAGVMVLGLALFLFVPAPYGRSIALALLLLGFSVLFLDHFSEERAAAYHAAILARLGG